MSSGENISPTAHYTGEVWRRAGLSHPWLGTREGRVMVDALRAAGDGSLAAIAAELDPAAGLAVVTEGLLGYLPTDAVLGLWRRLADTLAGFRQGRYVSDLHLASVQTPVVRVFRSTGRVRARGSPPALRRRGGGGGGAARGGLCRRGRAPGEQHRRAARGSAAIDGAYT
jgi:hypothetical protein